MTKYKIGDWVEHEKYGVGKVVAIYDSSVYGVQFKDYCPNMEESYLNPAPKTWETLCVGDIVIDKNGYEYEVLEVLTQSFLLSSSYNSDRILNWYTFKRAKECCWKIKDADPEPTVTVTLPKSKADELGLSY